MCQQQLSERVRDVVAKLTLTSSSKGVEVGGEGELAPREDSVSSSSRSLTTNVFRLIRGSGNGFIVLRNSW